MQAIEFPRVSDRQIQHLVDLQSSAAAIAALRAAAAGAPHDVLLVSADALLADRTNDAAFDRLRGVVTAPEFRLLVPGWIRELREIASAWPETGACTIATALKLWLWTFDHFAGEGRQPVDELTEALCPLVAARCLVLDAVIGGSGAAVRFDVAYVYAARVSASIATSCAELVFGYRKHLTWDTAGCATCYSADELDELEAFMPGFASSGRATTDVVEADGSHAAKRGPCAKFDGLDTFMRIRNRLDACLTGARIAKDRVAAAVAGRS